MERCVNSMRAWAVALIQQNTQSIYQRILICCIVLVTVLVVGQLDYDTHYAVDNESVLADSLFFQNSYSYVEKSSIGDLRWIIKKHTDMFPNLMSIVSAPLVHTAAAVIESVHHPAYATFDVTFHSLTPKQITLTGHQKRLTFMTVAGKREYHMLVPATFMYEFGRWPMSNAYYQQFGISSTTIEQNKTNTLDTRELVIAWFHARLRVFPTPLLSTVVVVFVLIPAVLAYGLARAARPHVALVLYALFITRWGYEYIVQQSLTVEPLLVALALLGVWGLLQRMIRAGYVVPITPRQLIVLAVMSVVLCEFSVAPVGLWRTGVAFDLMPHTADFMQFIGGMRAPLPIPLITLEYVLYRIHNELLFDVGYMALLPRIMVMVGIYISTDGLTNRIPKSLLDGLRVLFTACFAALIRYDGRNIILMYDVMIGVCLTLVMMIAMRQNHTSRDLLLLSLAIVAADMLRPFMLVITPLIVILVGINIHRRYQLQTKLYFYMPLIVLLIWHGYHIVVLNQFTWSNYSGFNIARAWYPEALAFTTAPKSNVDINDFAWNQDSAMLMREIVNWIRAHPGDALLHVPWLLWQTYQIPVNIARILPSGMSEVIVRTLPWYVVLYRVIMFVALWGVNWVFIYWKTKPLPVLMNAGMITFITVVVALSENGEQSRFLLSLSPAILFAFIQSVGAEASPTTHPRQ